MHVFECMSLRDRGVVGNFMIQVDSYEQTSIQMDMECGVGLE